MKYSRTSKNGFGNLAIARAALLVSLVLTACSTRVQTANELTQSTGTPSTQQTPYTQVPPSTPNYTIPGGNTTNVPIDTGTSTGTSTGTGTGIESGTGTSTGTSTGTGNPYPPYSLQPLQCELVREGGTFWTNQGIYWTINTNTGEPLQVIDIILSHSWAEAQIRFFSDSFGMAFSTAGEKWIQFYFRSASDPSRKCNGGQPLVDHLYVNSNGGYGY